MPALALTDHLSLTGSVEFYRACKSAGVQPILGLELDVQPPSGLLMSPAQPAACRLVLLAMDMEGWANLCRLSSSVLLQPSVQSLPFHLLNAHSAGLLCLTGGRRGLVNSILQQDRPENAQMLLSLLADSFPDRLYVELQRHSQSDQAQNDQLLELADPLRLPVVATHTIDYLKPHQRELQRTVTAIRLNCARGSAPETELSPPDAHFKSQADMHSAFTDLPAALNATQEIVSRCRLELPLGIQRYPVLPLKPGETPAGMLRRAAEYGAQKRFGKISPEIQSRLDQELAVIAERGYEAIFLIVQDILNHARETGVPTSSRGSAASSLVAHCLQITSPDPVALNLYFERFLNPARAKPPDIDTDICSRRRDDVIEYVFEKYGRDRTAMVGTINRYRPRSALGDVAKAYGLSPVEVRALTRKLPHHYFHLFGGEKTAPFADVQGESRYANLDRMLQDAEALLSIPRHLSVHPGGLVIAPGPITDSVPVQRSGSKGTVITQLDLDAVEQMGLVKIDLLGIRGLTVLGDVAEAVHSWERTRYKSTLSVLEAIPDEDRETSEIVSAGRTIGCFQIESPGMRATLMDIGARSPADIMAALALFRPGPLKGGLRDAFVRRHQHQEPVTHLHPALAPLLEETYGVVLYQEQVLRIANELAGLNLAESDLLRRAMSHFDPGKAMQTLKEKFIRGSAVKSGVPTETAERVWDLMASFAGYGFPKAHAASYAQVAWRSAWCKAHYPAEFLAAILANWGGYYGQQVYLTEARRTGLSVKPPHINHSQSEFCAAYPNGQPVLYMGLDQVRDLTHRTQEKILRLRPFHTLSDFLVRVDPRTQEAENLIRVGALDGFGSIPGLLKQLKEGIWRSGQDSLFSLFETAEEAQEPDLAERVAAQQAILGTNVDVHPMELYAEAVASSGSLTTLQAADRIGQTVRVAGMRQSWHRSRTSKGETMAFVSLEDVEGMVDLIVFPSEYRRYRSIFSGSLPFVVEGVVEIEEGRAEPFIRVERAWSLG
jgi:DNA-directed DNA polymerase III PolC